MLAAGVLIYFIYINGMAVSSVLRADKSIDEAFPDSSTEQRELIKEIYLLETGILVYEEDVMKIKRIESEEERKEFLENELKSLKERKESLERELPQ